jgi:hypothetical protein
MNTPIIFCHYGVSKYLKYSLLAAKISGNKECILIGDEKNKKITIEKGWTHIEFKKIKSEKINNFELVFKPISGSMHRNIKNNGDWLKFVFKRWFYIEEYCVQNNISHFFCFDSDTLVLDNLSKYIEKFSLIKGTSQCEGNCLNGFVSLDLLKRYTQHILNIYSDNSFIKMQELDLMSNKYFAFTEMRAFNDFNSHLNFDEKILPINCFFKNYYFDNALRHDEGFECVKVPLIGYKHKNIKRKGSNIVGVKNGEDFIFLTLNMSWLPVYYYRWPLKVIENNDFKLLSDELGSDWYTNGHLLLMSFYERIKYMSVWLLVKLNSKLNYK